MTDRREELAEQERLGWMAFLEQVALVPVDRREIPGVVPGWSVKDIVWHCIGWARFAGEHLQSMAGGTFADPFAGTDDSHWDRVSQEMIDQSRGMSFEEILVAGEDARERVHRTWSSIPAIDDDSARWFADETFLHYRDHSEEIARLLDEPQ